MFYTDFIEGRKIIRSDLLSGVEHFFTTRELCLFSKEADMADNRRVTEEFLCQKMATNQPVHGINIEKVVSGKFFLCRCGRAVIKERVCSLYEFRRLRTDNLVLWRRRNYSSCRMARYGAKDGTDCREKNDGGFRG